MRSQRNELFTTNWAIKFDKWILDQTYDKGQKYSHGTFTIYTDRPYFYLLLRIEDNKNNIVFNGYITTIAQYRNITKKIKGWT